MTRRQHIKRLPRRASIPKFLSPSEIVAVEELKASRPKMDWDEAVEKIVLRSVNLDILKA